MNFRQLQRKSQRQIEIPVENSKDLKFTVNRLKGEKEIEATENIFSFFSSVVSSKLGIRRKSSYNPQSPRKSLSDRRKSSNDVYRANRKNMLENISLLATGPCGVGMGTRSIFMDDQNTQRKEK